MRTRAHSQLETADADAQQLGAVGDAQAEGDAGSAELLRVVADLQRGWPAAPPSGDTANFASLAYKYSVAQLNLCKNKAHNPFLPHFLLRPNLAQDRCGVARQAAQQTSPLFQPLPLEMLRWTLDSRGHFATISDGLDL